MVWRPIDEHKFPWEPDRLTIAAHAENDDKEVELFICTCADHGNYYPDGSILALDEIGWVPFAWTGAPPAAPSKGE